MAHDHESVPGQDGAAHDRTAPVRASAQTSSDAAAADKVSTDLSVSAKASSEKGLGWWEWLSFSAMRRLLRLHMWFWGIGGLYASSRHFGTLEYLINYKRRRRVGQMLDVVLGENLAPSRRRQLIRDHFVRQRCDKVFYLIFDLLDREDVEARFSIVNRHLLDEGLARGKGVYTLLCHHGPHHVSGMIMSLLGYRVGGIRDPNEGAIRRYVQSLWERKYSDLPRPRVLYAGDFVRQVYRLFKDNYGLGSALDVSRKRDPRQKTCPVRIFGEQREFLTGTLQIALRCNAAVLQGFIIASDNFHYRLEFTGPMVDPDGDHAETPERLASIMQQYADNIADYARRYPDHISRA